MPGARQALSSVLVPTSMASFNPDISPAWRQYFADEEKKVQGDGVTFLRSQR
jgi:hypothetical protein